MLTLSDSPTGHLTLQFLAWIFGAPRTYGETMERWRTSCPRLSIWEDAIESGLVEVKPGSGPMKEAPVVLTAQGRALLADREGLNAAR
jgi:hypothetical protein